MKKHVGHVALGQVSGYMTCSIKRFDQLRSLTCTQEKSISQKRCSTLNHVVAVTSIMQILSIRSHTRNTRFDLSPAVTDLEGEC